jgi:hypothetical protein
MQSLESSASTLGARNGDWGVFPNAARVSPIPSWRVFEC